jgi:preprotein translocase subunit SecG
MSILLAIHVLVTIFLILIILIQKNEGGSSLFATNASGGLFNARGTSNVLVKATWVLSSIFLINCVVMATIASSNIKEAQTVIETKHRKPKMAKPQQSENIKATSEEMPKNEPKKQENAAQQKTPQKQANSASQKPPAKQKTPTQDTSTKQKTPKGNK